MDYRNFYKEKLKLVLTKEEEIHHIDFNRGNNSIENLVCLPKKLHKQYHTYLKLCNYGEKMFSNKTEDFNIEYSFEIRKWKNNIEKFKKIEKEVNSYIEKRNSLLLEVI